MMGDQFYTDCFAMPANVVFLLPINFSFDILFSVFQNIQSRQHLRLSIKQNNSQILWILPKIAKILPI